MHLQDRLWYDTAEAVRAGLRPGDLVLAHEAFRRALPNVVTYEARRRSLDARIDHFVLHKGLLAELDPEYLAEAVQLTPRFANEVYVVLSRGGSRLPDDQLCHLTPLYESALPLLDGSADEERWAIGIYGGISPLDLSASATVRNPVLSAWDVSDVRAEFLADPFMVNHEGRWYMFFEVMNRDTTRGEIGLAVSDDALHWDYRQIVLREPFHLSYPGVFRWNDEFFMIPETLQLDSVNVYRADPFPTHWTRVQAIVPIRCADPSIVRFADVWWLFGCAPAEENETLRLYYSDDLLGTWREHPASPIVEGNARIARPGGRVTLWGDILVRYAQDCRSSYGESVRAVNVTELTRTSYRETEVRESPVLMGTGHGWNSRSMHHVDPHLTPDGLWIACVDGQ